MSLVDVISVCADVVSQFAKIHRTTTAGLGSHVTSQLTCHSNISCRQHPVRLEALCCSAVKVQ
jgi:hypothetical protein